MTVMVTVYEAVGRSKVGRSVVLLAGAQVELCQSNKSVTVKIMMTVMMRSPLVSLTIRNKKNELPRAV